MSSKKTFVVTNGNNRIIHYRKTSPPKKSGILERYTYKTDDGELLPGTSFDLNLNRGLGSTNSVNTYSASSYLNNRTSQRCLIKSPDSIRSQRSASSDKMLERNKNVNKSDNYNSVRTEHCDSTTDIDVVSKNSRLSVPKQNGSDSDTSSEYNIVNYQLGDKKRVYKQESNQNYESDSDCQIVDVKPLDHPLKRRTFLKQMEWMIIANRNTNVGSVEVISDSDSDHSDLQSNQLTSSNQNIRQKSPLYASDDSLDSKIEEDLEPSVYEISDGIQIVLPQKNSNKPSKEIIENKKPRIEIISNVVVQSKPDFKNRINSFESECESSHVTSSEMHLRETTPTNFLPKSPKYDPTLSPESMKTEFYSYLKINTNPLAPKVETDIHQNRRSVRVKKLVEQNEKLREKNEKLKEEVTMQKREEIRAKFLKFSPTKIHFPSLDPKSETSCDFDEYIVKYFDKEGIDYKKEQKDTTLEKVIVSPKLETSYERKLLYKKIFTKPENKVEKSKKSYQNIENRSKKAGNEVPHKVVLVKNGPKDLNLKKIGKKLLLDRRLIGRRRTALNKDRILRRRPRVTRNSFPSYHNFTKKLLNSSIKVKSKKKIIRKEEESTDPPKKEPEKVEEVEKSSLSVLDRLDLLTQTVMLEYSYKDYSDIEALPNENCESTNQKIAEPNLEESPKVSNSTTEDLKSPDSPTDSCIGFKPDENIQNIRKNFANVLSNIILNDFARKEQKIPPKTAEIPPDESETPKNVAETKDTNIVPQNSYEVKEFCISPEIFNSEMAKNDKVQNYIPLNPNVVKKSFHHSLTVTPKKKSEESSSRSDPLYTTNSNFSFLDEDTQPASFSTVGSLKKSRTHEIDIQKQNGPVFNAYYVNCTLIIVQELLISFWKQTPLGNILGAQNMWYSIGNIKRLMLERGCINRRSSEMVLNVDSSVAYIELWTKEHQSDFRERPVTDVFATVYFHKGHGLPDKKVLQLENIKGYGNDVRFAILKNSREIVVSWYETFSTPAKAIIRSYQLAPDFQTISSTKEMESVEHFVLSLHNIENCDSLVLGAGSEQISIWNLAHGWLSTTVSFDTTSVQIHSMCLWAHCETGYLFLLQQIGRGILRLVAVNGVSSQWKQLQIYHVPECYESLLGVTIESGILMTCYTNGFLCYEMQSGDLLSDTETPINRIILPSEKFLVSLDDFKISVKHVMIYVLEN